MGALVEWVENPDGPAPFMVQVQNYAVAHGKFEHEVLEKVTAWEWKRWLKRNDLEARRNAARGDTRSEHLLRETLRNA